jgi:hypothetical protein
MKVTYELDSEKDDPHNFEQLHKAGDYYATLCEIDSRLRSVLKYEKSDQINESLLEEIRRMIGEVGI